MKPGRGKAKGNAFERDMCRKLSEFWSDGKFNDLCWRSASSGARGTTSRTTIHGFHGDLVATSPLIESFFKTFSVELKFYKELDITQVLRDIQEPRLQKFWKQTMESAALSNRVPILIFKTNFMPELLVCKKSTFTILRSCLQEAFIGKLPYVGICGELYLVNFNTLLLYLNRELFMQLVENWPEEKGLCRTSMI